MSEQNIQHLSDDNFSEEIAKGTVLVDFFAEWCGPCRMLTPLLEKLAGKKKIKIVKVDTDRAPNVSAQFGVSSIPTLVLLKGGKEQKRHVGLLDEKGLETFIST